MANQYGKKFTTDSVNVVWSHLHKPDTKFGNPNYNITVELTPELESAIKDAASKAGFGKISKVNGVGNREDGKVLKVKNSQACKDGQTGAFGCVDAKAKSTKAVPFGGDVVRLKLVPCLLERDNSLSIYLDGCQIIEKHEREETGDGGFGVVEGGFDGADAEAPVVKETVESEAVVAEDDDADLPF